MYAYICAYVYTHNDKKHRALLRQEHDTAIKASAVGYIGLHSLYL